MKLVIAFLLSIPLLHAEALPDAPIRKPQANKIDIILIAADATVRNVDVISTRWMLNRGDRELSLPSVIVSHAATMALYSNAVVAANWYSSRMLAKHGHPKLARAVIAIDIAQDGFWAFHNFTLPDRRK